MDEFLNHGSLFTGIGGFDLAAQWAGITNIFQVEIDPFCLKVLEKNFPSVKRYKDIKDFDGTKYKETIDILSGGEPCQPNSNAGLRKGISDKRYLWPEYFRVTKAIRPRFIVNENVSGSISNGVLDQKIFDLESIGYTCWAPIIIPANFLGAWHKRGRVWLVAHANVQRRGRFLRGKDGTIPEAYSKANALDTQCNPFLQFEKSMGESAVFGMADGVPRRMDIVKRLGALGNAVVPQIPYRIFMAIKNINNNDNH